MSFRRGYRLVHRSGPRRRNLLYPMCTKGAARAVHRCLPPPLTIYPLETMCLVVVVVVVAANVLLVSPELITFIAPASFSAGENGWYNRWNSPHDLRKYEGSCRADLLCDDSGWRGK